MFVMMADMVAGEDTVCTADGTTMLGDGLPTCIGHVLMNRHKFSNIRHSSRSDIQNLAHLARKSMPERCLGLVDQPKIGHNKSLCRFFKGWPRASMQVAKISRISRDLLQNSGEA